MFKFWFSAPLVLDGVHIVDIDCAANIRLGEDDPSDWYVESWSVGGVDSERWQNRHRVEKEIEISRSREKEPLKEILRKAIADEWHRNRVVYAASVASMISEDHDEPVSIQTVL